MNKVILGTLIGLILVVGGYFFLTNQNVQAPTTTLSPTGFDQMAERDVESPQGRYIQYSPEEFEAQKDKKRVLFFYANWCPICRPADQDFIENENLIPQDTVLIRVNYNDSDTDDSERALANKYGITYQHTFVQISENGMEITKWNGGQTDELLANIK